MHRFVALLTTTLALTACASSPYVEPTSDPLASLSVIPNGAVAAYSYDDAATCTQRRMIIGVKDREPRTINVPTDRPISLTYTWDIGSSMSSGYLEFVGCAPTITFTPQQGRLYRLTAPSRDQCLVTLVDERGTSVEFTQRDYRRGAGESSSFCS